MARQPGDGRAATSGPQSISVHSRSEPYLSKHQIVRATGRECGGKMQHSEQLLRSPDGLGTGCVRGVQGHGGNLYVHRIWFSLRCTGSAFYRLKKKKH